MQPVNWEQIIKEIQADFKYLMVLGLLFILLFASAELLRRKFYLKGEYTRKYVHSLTGIFTILFPILLSSIWSVVLLCSLFAVILFISKRSKQLNSIHGVKRTTHGSLWYPVAVSLSFFAMQQFSSIAYFYIPVLTMALADPAAALVGQRYPIKKYTVFGDTKSWGGSLAFVCVGFAISAAFFYAFSNSSVFYLLMSAFIIAAITAFAEAISKHGADNISIPLTAIFVLLLLQMQGLIAF